MAKRNKNGPDQEYALVYSTDPMPVKRCGNCLRPQAECRCAQQTINGSPVRPAARIEKKGRGGKSVTVISRLPASKKHIEELLSFLKRSLGCGGTSYLQDGQGIIELQGERAEQALKAIEKFAEKPPRDLK